CESGDALLLSRTAPVPQASRGPRRSRLLLSEPDPRAGRGEHPRARCSPARACRGQTWSSNVVDADGFRPNVGLIIFNGEGEVLCAKRVGQDAWRFPQGGILRHERPEKAALRELREEVGLEPEAVEIVAS